MRARRLNLSAVVSALCAVSAVAAVAGCGATGSAANTGTSSNPTLAIRFAQCMRTHGVPSYPDPVFPSTGGVEISVGSVDPQSPAFTAAAKVCGSPFPGGGPLRRFGSG
ncbi:MAG TPA: hypothetical protein VIK04_17635 [Solirubrobacteraceae bacterium]